MNAGAGMARDPDEAGPEWRQPGFDRSSDGADPEEDHGRALEVIAGQAVLPPGAAALAVDDALAGGGARRG